MTLLTSQAHVSLKVWSSRMLTHTSQFPSLRSKQEGVLDSTRQNVLGDDGLCYWTLVLVRAGVGCIDRPNRRMHYLRRSPAAHELRGSPETLSDRPASLFSRNQFLQTVSEVRSSNITKEQNYRNPQFLTGGKASWTSLDHTSFLKVRSSSTRAS